MFRLLLLLALVVAAFLTVAALRGNLRHSAAAHAALPAARHEHDLAQQVLWVWERPEDLRALYPPQEAAAVLEGTLHLGRTSVFTPRRQPYLLPANTSRIAVVRIEASPDFAPSASLLHDAVQHLARIANTAGVAALQIDFDARRSQRAFYRDLLQALRPALPASLPLDITALVSWCSNDDWIADLPVNTATPMFFRMEPDRARWSKTTRPSADLAEPLCSHSVGVSTREPWPTGIAGKRVYVFADDGWRTDLPLLRARESQPGNGPQAPSDRTQPNIRQLSESRQSPKP